MTHERDEIFATNLDQIDLPTLAAGLVHEVKNPLAAIHLHLQLLENYAEQIEQEELRDKMSRKVQLIKREILTLNQMLHDFFRMIRPDSLVTERRGELNTILHEVVQFIEPQMVRYDVSLLFRPGSIGSESEILFDQTFVRQIALNLLLNSLQALRSAERSAGGEEPQILLASGSKGDEIWFRVSDNGPGIPEPDREKIFDLFFTTKEEGSGLGLALVKKMVTEMGGRIELESRLGEGSSFTIYLGKGQRLLE